MTEQKPPGSWEEVASRTPVRLRLVVAVPVAVTLFTLAAGVGALNVLDLLDPRHSITPEARFWATVLVVGFALLAGGLAYLLARQLQRPIRDFLSELRTRAPLPRRAKEGEGTRPPAVPNEFSLAQRTVGEYLHILDEYRLDAALLDQMQEAVFLLDRKGRILHANQQAEGLVGDDGPLEGRPLDELAETGAGNLPFRSFLRRGLESAESAELSGGGSASVWEDVTVETPAKGPVSVRARIYVSSRGFELEDAGEDGSFRFLPSRGNADTRLILTLSDLSQEETMAERVERRERLAALGTLVSEVAHEVRNPLGSLRSLAELLAGKLPDDDPKREHLESISRRIDSVVAYLEDVLDYAQPRRLELGEVDLRPLLEEAVESVRPRALDRGLALSWSVEEGLDVLPEADRNRLHQVLTNLLRNAVSHAGEEGRVTVSARRARRPEEGEEEDGPFVEISVFNSGSYIPEGRREEIFKPFTGSRADSTGLGLTVTRYLVRMHGGRVEVESEEGEGTTFRVLLPAG